MQRGFRLCLLLVVAGVLMWSPRAIAQADPQTAKRKSHVDPVCGFSFSYPETWREYRDSEDKRKIVVESREHASISTQVTVGPIWDFEDWSIEGLRAGVDALTCLECRSDDLVWRGRFTVRSMKVLYTMYNRDITVGDQVYPHYRMDFYLIDDGTARNLGSGGVSLTQARALVPKPRFRMMEQEIMTIVRSLRFTPPQLICW